MRDRNQSPGRERNAAEPLGERPGLESDRLTEKIGKEERRTAGPDWPDANGPAKATTGTGRISRP